MVDETYCFMICYEALIEDDFPSHFLQIFQLISLQGWQSNRQKPPTTSRHGMKSANSSDWRLLEIFGNRCQSLAKCGSCSKRGTIWTSAFNEWTCGQMFEVFAGDLHWNLRRWYPFVGLSLPGASWQVASRQTTFWFYQVTINQRVSWLKRRQFWWKIPTARQRIHSFSTGKLIHPRRQTVDGFRGGESSMVFFCGKPSQGDGEIEIWF